MTDESLAGLARQLRAIQQVMLRHGGFSQEERETLEAAARALEEPPYSSYDADLRLAIDALNQAQQSAFCPKCGSGDGSLGTSFAYFICRVCKREIYWTPDHDHPGDWNVAIEASPYARLRRQREEAAARLRSYLAASPLPTKEQP